MDSKAYSVLVLLMAGTLLAGCLGEADFNEPVPVWEPGFAWTYDQRASAEVGASISGPDGSDSRSTMIEVLLTSRYEVLNADATIAGEPAYLVAVQVRLLELRIDDQPVWTAGEPLPDDPELQAMLTEACTTQECRSFAWYTVADLAYAEDPEAPTQLMLDFPLSRGKTWQTGGVQVNDQDAVLEAQAVRLEDRTWSGGTEPTIRIETTIDPGFAKQMQREIKAESGGDASVSVNAHGTGHYAPAVRNVLASDTGVAIRLSATNDDTTMTTRVAAEVVEEVVDHVLDPKPARTMDEFLAGQQHLPLPPPEPWPFAITASATQVDAAAAEEVTFSVDTAASQLEPGATIRWTHSRVDASGPQQTHANGESYAATITDAGRHTVLATVHDANGALRGTAKAHVDAFARVTLSADGPIGAAVLPGDDPAVGFFVAPGWSQMTITAAPGGVALGTLSVGPSEGPVESIDVSPLQDTYEVTVTDASGPFNVTWSDAVRVLGAAFTIETHYGPSEEETQNAALAAGLRVLRETGLFGTGWRG